MEGLLTRGLALLSHSSGLSLLSLSLVGDLPAAGRWCVCVSRKFAVCCTQSKSGLVTPNRQNVCFPFPDLFNYRKRNSASARPAVLVCLFVIWLLSISLSFALLFLVVGTVASLQQQSAVSADMQHTRPLSRGKCI